MSHDKNINDVIEIGLIEEEITADPKNDLIKPNDLLPCFVALHIGTYTRNNFFWKILIISFHIKKGAGFHSVAKTGAYRELCEKACRETMILLKQGLEARKAVAKAVELLEVFINFTILNNYFHEIKYH